MKRLALGMLLLGFFFSSQIAQADWSPVTRLTWTSGPSTFPAIAIDSNSHIHVVWEDSTPFNYEIYYKKSTDGGATWSGAQRLTSTSGSSFSPAIAIDSDNNPHVVWYDETPGNFEIYYKKSTDGGTTWSTIKRLTWISDTSYYPVIATDSSNVIHVVWEDGTPSSGYEINYKRSTDGGATWGETQRLTWTSGTSAYPAIALDSSDTIHVVWQEHLSFSSEIYYKKSTDAGTTWSAAKRLTWTNGQVYAYDPAIAIDSGNIIHVVWSHDKPGNREIYYKKSADGGTTWGATQRLTWTSGESWHPAIAADSGNTIHVVWQDNTPGNDDIYYKRSTDGGATWSAAQRLTSNSGDSLLPAIAADSGNTIHIVWYDDTPGSFEIYYIKGT